MPQVELKVKKEREINTKVRVGLIGGGGESTGSKGDMSTLEKEMHQV